MIDQIGDALEERSRAWLAPHPTPPEDEFDRTCWQAMTNYVTMMDDIRRHGHVEPPAHDGQPVQITPAGPSLASCRAGSASRSTHQP